MLTIDNIANYIDWWHEPTIDETFEHEGDLLNYTISPTLSIGINDYWMASITQLIGYRGMGWDKPNESIHHRTENSTTDFANAIGGLLGDTHLNLRYLVLNAGSTDGYRFFLGTGIIIPSKNSLKADPFFLEEQVSNDTIFWSDGEHEHRHFSMSEGAYKSIFEIQLFKKQTINPVFYGFSLKAILPLKESKYGFKPSNVFEISFSMMSNTIKAINASLGANLALMHSTTAKWNDIEAPNSKSSILLPGLSYIKEAKKGTITIGIQKPIFITGSFAGNEGDLKQRVNALQFSLGYRQILNTSIPFLN